MIVVCSCYRFQSIDFIAVPEYSHKCKDDGFLEIDDLFRWDDGLVLGLFAEQLN